MRAGAVRYTADMAKPWGSRIWGTPMIHDDAGESRRVMWVQELAPSRDDVTNDLGRGELVQRLMAPEESVLQQKVTWRTFGPVFLMLLAAVVIAIVAVFSGVPSQVIMWGMPVVFVGGSVLFARWMPRHQFEKHRASIKATCIG